MIVSTLTDSSQVTTDKQSYIKKLESSSKIILTLFQSWAGILIIYLEIIIIFFFFFFFFFFFYC